MIRSLVTVRRGIACCSVALACLVGVVPAASLAQAAEPTEEDISRARRLFMRGIEYEQARNWGKALELYREVGQVKLTPQVRYHIATCEENLGKLVAALGGYELALADADQVGEAFKQDVTQQIEQLRARIPKLVIQRGEGAEAATIMLDGVELGASSIGVEVPIDPGPHAVTANAPGYEDFMDTVSLDEEQRKVLKITLERVPSGGSEVGRGSGSTGDQGVTQPPPDRTVPYIIGGAGVASLLAGGAFYFLREAKIAEYEEICNLEGGKCPSDQKDEVESLRSSAKAYGIMGWVSVGMGAAAVGVAGYLILTEPETGKQAASLRLAPLAPGADAGVSVIGRF
jgi:tetratricopeptide (TPR) repeat protein